MFVRDVNDLDGSTIVTNAASLLIVGGLQALTLTSSSFFTLFPSLPLISH